MFKKIAMAKCEQDTLRGQIVFEKLVKKAIHHEAHLKKWKV